MALIKHTNSSALFWICYFKAFVKTVANKNLQPKIINIIITLLLTKCSIVEKLIIFYVVSNHCFMLYMGLVNMCDILMLVLWYRIMEINIYHGGIRLLPKCMNIIEGIINVPQFLSIPMILYCTRFNMLCNPVFPRITLSMKDTLEIRERHTDGCDTEHLHRGDAEDLRILRCHLVSLDEFPKFRRIIFPSSSGSDIARRTIWTAWSWSILNIHIFRELPTQHNSVTPHQTSTLLMSNFLTCVKLYLEHVRNNDTLITNLMHWLLFIHKILFSSTCFEH